MNLKKIFIRSQNLLINPGSEFSLIAEERPEQPGITRNFTLPMSLLVALFALLGSAFSNITLPINSFLYVVFNAVIVFFMILTHTYLSGKAISLLGRNISPADKPSVYYALSAYSQLPFFLILALVKLLPSLIFLIVLSFYSALLFHTGCGILTGIPRGKKLQFTLLSVLIIITSFIICSELYTLLYTEIMEQFSTFVVY
jgi:hypothetical protein